MPDRRHAQPSGRLAEQGQAESTTDVVAGQTDVTKRAIVHLEQAMSSAATTNFARHRIQRAADQAENGRGAAGVPERGGEWLGQKL